MKKSSVVAKKITPIEESKPKSQVWAWIAVGIVLLLVAIVRIRLLSAPLERDEGEYAYAGQLILQKIPPYSLACNMKLPGIYLAYAVIMALFTQTTVGIHIGLMLINLAAIVLVFLLGRRIYDAYAGVFAALAYACMTLTSSVLGFHAHATHFIVVPALAGIMLILKAIDNHRSDLVFWSGLLLGTAFTMKQPGVFLTVFGGLYLIFGLAQTRSVGWSGIAKRFGLYLVGAVTPFVLICVWMLATGVFTKFWFWTFTYASQYASMLPLSTGVMMFQNSTPPILSATVWAWVLAGLGLTALAWDKPARSKWVFTLGFFIFSFLCVCVGGYFRQHYYVTVLPAASLLAGIGLASMLRAVRRVEHGTYIQLAPILIVLVAAGYYISQQGDYLFEMTPLESSRAEYGMNPFPEAIEIAKYIEAHSSPTDTVAVVGSEPEIYFLSHRHSATGTIYVYPLMEPQPFALQMQKDMISDIEKAKPRYLVLALIPSSWMARPDSNMLIMNWAQTYAAKNYHPVGFTETLQYSTQYTWGADAAHYQPQANYYCAVFERTDK